MTSNNQDKKTYVTIPGKGDHELSSLLDTINYLRQLTWTYKVWTPTPALIDKTGGSSRKYVGQKYDPNYIDLVADGWTHDHCEVCYEVISDIETDSDKDGYTTDNSEWLCKDCYKLFIKPANANEIIGSLKTTEK